MDADDDEQDIVEDPEMKEYDTFEATQADIPMCEDIPIVSKLAS